MSFRPKTLQQQLMTFVLLPVALLLLGLGWAGFIYTRTTLLQQWGEATMLKLQRLAHQIDMELNRPKNLLAMLHSLSGSPAPGQQPIKDWIVDELKRLEGVLQVAVTPLERTRPGRTRHPAPASAAEAEKWGGHRSHPGRGALSVSSPRYNPSLDNQIVSLITELTDSDGHPAAQIELMLSFDRLVALISEAEWWQHQESLIVDDQGQVLFGTRDGASQGDPAAAELLPDPLRREIAGRFSGTLRTRNGGRDRVNGYYRLSEAPWTLVISAPAKAVLTPIRRFRSVYLALGLGIVVSVLLLIRLTTARAVAAIREVGQAAEKVAIGNYRIDLKVRGSDEIGELMQRFNAMARQLEEGAHMKRSLLLAQEVQQSLLPTGRLATAILEIAGDSRYCDETGGDYFDYILLPRKGAKPELYAVVVGDVTGHGIAAALLMSTARALLRCRIDGIGNPARAVSDVNRLLCNDTADTGSFITLFLLCFSPDGARLSWVRAGHDPALLYDPSSDGFVELNGKGIALGVDGQWEFSESHYQPWRAGQVVLMGTDGIWEAENHKGERFGRARLKAVVRRCAADPAEEILNAVMTAVDRFRGLCKAADDITLVVVKRRLEGDPDSRAPMEVARTPGHLGGAKEDPIGRSAT